MENGNKLHINEKRIVLLSDFDGTLCDKYTFDSATNNHTPLIDQRLVEVVRDKPLVVATARRANHPSIPAMWHSGLVKEHVPVITENGGVLNTFNGEMVQNAPRDILHETRFWIENNLHNIEAPPGQKLITKHGLTMVIARFQDELGNSAPQDQRQLLRQFEELGIPPWMRIENSGGSLSLQSAEVNKWNAFERVLGRVGLSRAEVFVVGFGDAPNDRSIFDNADFSVGVNRRVHPFTDVKMLFGPSSTRQFLSQQFGMPFAKLEGLDLHRSNIDKEDTQLIATIARRWKHTQKVGRHKAENGMNAVSPERRAQKLEEMRMAEIENNLPDGMLQRMFDSLMNDVENHHRKIRKELEGDSDV